MCSILSLPNSSGNLISTHICFVSFISSLSFCTIQGRAWYSSLIQNYICDTRVYYLLSRIHFLLSAFNVLYLLLNLYIRWLVLLIVHSILQNVLSFLRTFFVLLFSSFILINSFVSFSSLFFVIFFSLSLFASFVLQVDFVRSHSWIPLQDTSFTFFMITIAHAGIHTLIFSLFWKFTIGNLFFSM